MFTDNKGTCSTKHAILTQLATEHNFNNIKLMLGIFKMNAKNTPKTEKTLLNAKLTYIPEAHNYIKFEGKIYDFTKSNCLASNFSDDLLFETEMEATDIHFPKIKLHKTFLEDWLKQNPNIEYTLQDLWNIREQCIADLAS